MTLKWIDLLSVVLVCFIVFLLAKSLEPKPQVRAPEPFKWMPEPKPYKEPPPLPEIREPEFETIKNLDFVVADSALPEPEPEPEPEYKPPPQIPQRKEPTIVAQPVVRHTILKPRRPRFGWRLRRR